MITYDTIKKSKQKYLIAKEKLLPTAKKYSQSS